ncbi:MAG: hypothetical protein U0166_06710 [Acidobacteriota bacterium]
MRLDFELTGDGLEVGLDGRRARIRWPGEVWQPFTAKRELATELVYLLTSGLALGQPGAPVRYGFGRPRFLDLYDRWLDSTRPYLAGSSAPTKRRSVPPIAPSRPGPGTWRYPDTEPDRAVAALTMGKDSLASLVVARGMGLGVAGVLCQHPSISDDHLIRSPAMAAVGAELGLELHSMIDDVKGLTRSAAASAPSGSLWSLSIASYALMLVPFAATRRARYVLVGNEQELSHPLRVASGAIVVASPLQSIAGMGELDRWLGALTSGGLRLTSVVHALHRLAGHWLIHRARPSVGVHQISCRAARADRRWCGACRTCAENALFIAACGRDPTSLGLPPMFGAEHREHFFVTDRAPDPTDPFRFRLAEQELLAFATLAPSGEDTFVQRLVRRRHGSALEAGRSRLERAYLRPVEPASGLPLAAMALECARDLLTAGPG